MREMQRSQGTLDAEAARREEEGERRRVSQAEYEAKQAAYQTP